ncbi:TatD family hydrolase [Oceanicoccus sp. KOV_DT_Chl]|uniref:TatD family hydrolase n=1 Tax=Oceanicoccus sp. KOV_DT_Chl TaxID=1904639 RepID=UPI001F3861BB
MIKRASQAGVAQIIVTGTNIEESHAAAALATQYPQQLFSTAGIHPHDAKSFHHESCQQLADIAVQPVVRAIGECGLDYNRMFSTKPQQIAAFESQIELAAQLQLPLFLHERDAHQAQLEILKHYRDQISAAVIHCFTGEKRQAFNYLDLDFSIGITGWICDERRGQHLHEFIADIPINYLMIETDAPYLMPRVKPKPELPSSRRNEPCTLPLVLSEIARHHHYSLEDIARHTTDNAINFFRLKE